MTESVALIFNFMLKMSTEYLKASKKDLKVSIIKYLKIWDDPFRNI